jgi:PIN domain nuclease of toxin-antitoxin system
MTDSEAPLVVTDTHALIWAIGDKRKRLGKRAKRLFDRADDRKGAIYIPAIALVELGEACRRGQVTLNVPFSDWARFVFESGKYHEAPLTTEIVCIAQRLYDIPERGDRLIAATAVAMDLPLITRDPQIAEVAGIECIWS